MNDSKMLIAVRIYHALVNIVQDMLGRVVGHFAKVNGCHYTSKIMPKCIYAIHQRSNSLTYLYPPFSRQFSKGLHTQEEEEKGRSEEKHSKKNHFCTLL